MSELAPSLSSVFVRFSAFERDANLFSREVCGVRFWHYVRFNVYSTLVLPHFVRMDAAHPDMHIKAVGKNGFPDRVFSRIRRGWRSFRMLTLGNPSFALKRRDVLLSLVPRTTSLADGRRIRLAVDFFVGKLKSSWCVLELPVGETGYPPNDGPGRRFKWEAAKRAIAGFRASRSFRDLRPAIEAESKRLAREISERFAIDVDETVLRRRIASAVILERAAVPLLRRWLRRLDVKCVVEVVHYASANMALTRAAHEEGFPVVELQHGTVLSAHAAYNLPFADSPYSPDYLLAWGDWWIRQPRNFPARRAVPTGYPFLEDALARHPRKPQDGVPCVLFISQGTIGRRLSELAVELCRIMGLACRVTFKPHPNEAKSWRTLYPALSDSGVEVAEDTTRDIYSWLAEADAVAGVYSTAVIEGLVWGAKTYVFKSLPGADIMAPFCTGGSAEYVDGAEDLAVRLRMQFAAGRSREPSFDRTDFFVDNAAANIAAAIDRIAEGKEP